MYDISAVKTASDKLEKITKLRALHFVLKNKSISYSDS